MDCGLSVGSDGWIRLAVGKDDGLIRMTVGRGGPQEDQDEYFVAYLIRLRDFDHPLPLTLPIIVPCDM